MRRAAALSVEPLIRQKFHRDFTPESFEVSNARIPWLECQCVLSPEFQECMDQTKGALLRAHTAGKGRQGAAKPPKLLGSAPGAN